MTGTWIAAFVALWILLAAVAGVVLGVLRRTLVALDRVEARVRLASVIHPGDGLEMGEQAPRVVGRTSAGRHVSWEFGGSPSLVLFLGAHCRPCHDLAHAMRTASGVRGDTKLRIVVDDSDDGRKLAEGLPGQILYQSNSSVARAFKTVTTPHAFAISKNGSIVEVAIPHSLEELELLAACARKGGDHRPAEHKGDLIVA
jgi:AhpC/TSA family